MLIWGVLPHDGQDGTSYSSKLDSGLAGLHHSTVQTPKKKTKMGQIISQSEK